MELIKSKPTPTHERPPGGHAMGVERSADGAPVIEYTTTRVLDVAPKVLERSRLINGRGGDPVTRAYKLLRTQVLQKLVKQGWQTIAVVSPRSGEGKTVTAINLAISLATAHHYSTLLVDLDWQQPSVHTYFDCKPEHDVRAYLNGEQPLSAALVNPGLPRFCFLPCTEPVADSSERLASLGSFVAELSGRYRNRIVLFDLPPLLATDDALGFLPFVDCALLVVEESKTQRAEITESLAMIGEDRLLGSVINKSRQVLPEY